MCNHAVLWEIWFPELAEVPCTIHLSAYHQHNMGGLGRGMGVWYSILTWVGPFPGVPPPSVF